MTNCKFKPDYWEDALATEVVYREAVVTEAITEVVTEAEVVAKVAVSEEAVTSPKRPKRCHNSPFSVMASTSSPSIPISPSSTRRRRRRTTGCSKE